MRTRGKNYLQQTERTIPSGSYGEQAVSSAAWTSSRSVLFNSSNGATIGINIRKVGDADLTPANVGSIYIAEGDVDPVANGVELSLFQGGITTKGDDSYPNAVYHLMRYGDDGYGNIQQYKPNGDTFYIPKRCGTELYELEPYTYYSLARVGGDEDIEISWVIGRHYSRTVSVEFVDADMPSIPNNSSTTVNEAQWSKMSVSETYQSSNTSLPVDNRALCYDNCTAFATLKAGHYKVIAEAVTDNTEWLQTMMLNDDLPYFVLLDENNNKIMPKTEIFEEDTLWHHEEYEFTLNMDVKVGLFFKCYHTNANPTFFRFMIVDYDEELVPFDITTQYGQITGESCWEPFFKYSGAFVRAVNLKEVTLPDTLRSIGEWSFADTSLKRVTLPPYCTYYETSFPPDCVVEGGIIIE